MIKLFTPTIDSIITLMKNTLSNRSTNDLSTILMVGGFSECPLIQDAVQAAFPGKRIIIPEDAGMSVLKGAVLFGHRPGLIIKSALNLNLSPHRVILSTYDDEPMADSKLFPPNFLHFPSIATNGIVTLMSSDTRCRPGSVPWQANYNTGRCWYVGIERGCFIWSSSGFHSVTCDEMQLRRKDCFREFNCRSTK
jgi:hypothetical protein